MKKNHFKVLFSFVLMALVMLSCENNLEMVLPQGPQGEKGDKGDKGDPGASAFELWKEFYDKDPNTPIEEFFESLRGPQGFTPVADETTGNWFINGEDTGKPWRGEDGTTPTVAIGPGPGFFWIINGETTAVSAKGEDGKDGEDGQDGYTPVIGENGNWFINGVDQNKPSVIIPEIGPGPNFNWFINGEDTGYPSRGADGAPGKTAYELWKDHLGDNCDGTITLNDNSNTPWPCDRDSWEDFLEWLQGGKISQLHQHWITLPGNEGKTIEEFIEELFDCHCDGITVGVTYEDTCVELNPDGTVKGTYNATLTIGGKAGTSVVVTGTGVNLNGNITNDQTPVTFTIPRGAESIPLTIVCTESGNAVTKNAIIPALKYIKLDGATTVTQVPSEQKDVVVINFATAPVEVLVGGTVIYNASGVVEGSGWAISNEGKTFTRTYDRGANVQSPTVQAKGADPICSIIENAFTIPTLTPVVLNQPAVAAITGDLCNLQLTVTGSEGMTVTATYPGATAADPAIESPMTESPDGTYTFSGLPRRFASYTVTVTAEKPGHGTVTQTVIVPAQINVNSLGVTNGNGSAPYPNAIVTNRYTNNFGVDITLRFTSRTTGSGTGRVKRTPESDFPFSVTIPAGQYADVEFYRDYTPTFATGYYDVNYEIVTECGAVSGNRTSRINNQQDYQAGFSRPGGIPGWGTPGNPGNENWVPSEDPNATITFEVSLTNAIPNSWVEFSLVNASGIFQGKFVAQVDANGNYSQNVTMSEKDFAAAYGTGENMGKNKARFLFYGDYTDGQPSSPYDIGSKSLVDFKFD